MHLFLSTFDINASQLLSCYSVLISVRTVGIVGDSNAYDQSKRLRTGDYTQAGYSSPVPFHPPPPPVWGPHG